MRLEDFSKERLCELANYAIQGMLEDDRENAMEYIHNTMNMNFDECEFFDIDIADYTDEWGKVCPQWGKKYIECSTLSRVDNRTVICPDCGENEETERIIKWLIEE